MKYIYTKFFKFLFILNPITVIISFFKKNKQPSFVKSFDGKNATAIWSYLPYLTSFKPFHSQKIFKNEEEGEKEEEKKNERKKDGKKNTTKREKAKKMKREII